MEEENSSWFKAYSYITPKSAVLDIGCSSGTFGKVLMSRKDCEVDGIELDEQDFKHAKVSLREAYRLNIETDDLSIINKQYDFIYFGDVIEHLVHPGPTLKRVQSLLKPTAKVVFSIPNMSHISVRLMLLQGRFTYGETGLLDKTHLHFYTHQEVQRVFEEGGYFITDLDPVLKDLPKELLEKDLQQVGLRLTPEFIKFSGMTEASVYQFVGTAEPRKNHKQKSKKLDISSPVDRFQTYLEETKQYYEKISASDKLHISKQEKLVAKLNQDVAILTKELKSTAKQLTLLQNHRLIKISEKVNSLRKKS